MVLASDLLKQPVAAVDTQSSVGRVRDVLIDVETGAFEGVTVTVDWLGKPKFVSSQDIVSIDPHGLVINSQSHLFDLGEVVRAKKIHDQRFRLIGLKVITQNTKKRLGNVSDIVISLQINKIVKLYADSLLEHRVIPWEKIVKIERRAVIVEDDIEPVKVDAVGAIAEG